MKRFIGAALLCVAGAAYAQDDAQTARNVMADALINLGQHSAVTINLNGTASNSAYSVPIRCTAALQIADYNGRPSAYMELITYSNNQMAHRVAGDGYRLWSYDVARKEYSSAAYGTEAGEQLPNARRQMLMLTSRWAPQLASQPMKVLLDAFAGPDYNTLTAKWTPYIPTANMTWNGDTMQITATSTQRGTNEMTYSFDMDDQGRYHLRSVYYKNSILINNDWNVTEWTATVTPNSVPEYTIYTFEPPRGSRAVAITSNRSGG